MAQMLLGPSAWELFDIGVMTLAVGYIFHRLFRLPHKRTVDPLLAPRGFSWPDFWFACSVAAPAFLLHELGHKLTALSFGFSATFHAQYYFLAFGVLLTLLNTGVIFFVPAYVQWVGNPLPLQSSLIAFAGPGVNLLIWLVAWLVVKNADALKLSTRSRAYFILTRKLNLLLFGINMIPLPFIDGWSVYAGLLKAFFGIG